MRQMHSYPDTVVGTKNGYLLLRQQEHQN